jgi:outer membrane protein TolC
MKNLPKPWLLAFIALMLIMNLAKAQETISLKSILDSTIRNYPLSKQGDLFDAQGQLKTEEIERKNLPQVELNAKATYQSQVVGIDLPIPNFELTTMSKDQYRFTIDIQQSIYKGNATHHQKELIASQIETQHKQLEMELQQVKISVVELYFGILFNHQQNQILNSYQLQMNSKINEFNSLVKNGTLLISALDGLKLEQIRLQQQLKELEIDRLKLLQNINEISGLQLDTNTIFETPNTSITKEMSPQRIELQLMELQQKQISINQQMSNSKYLPMVYAFGTAGYGRPGFNYLSNEFEPFYMVGIGMNWKIWTWQANKREKQILDLNQKIIETQKTTFSSNLQRTINSYLAEMQKLESLIQQDKEIVRLQKSIAQSSENLFKNGVITSSQWVDELQKVNQYELNEQAHLLKLSLVNVNYSWVLGRL